MLTHNTHGQRLPHRPRFLWRACTSILMLTMLREGTIDCIAGHTTWACRCTRTPSATSPCSSQPTFNLHRRPSCPSATNYPANYPENWTGGATEECPQRSAHWLRRFELYFQELDIDGAFADYVESEKFYFRARRQNAAFPRRQVSAVYDAACGLDRECVFPCLRAVCVRQLPPPAMDALLTAISCALWLQVFPQVSTATNASATL
jgi:hypothetical protein